MRIKNFSFDFYHIIRIRWVKTIKVLILTYSSESWRLLNTCLAWCSTILGNLWSKSPKETTILFLISVDTLGYLSNLNNKWMFCLQKDSEIKVSLQRASTAHYKRVFYDELTIVSWTKDRIQGTNYAISPWESISLS